MGEHRTIAYFLMEIGLEGRLPTYSGGLGVLAGDTIRDELRPMASVASVTIEGRTARLMAWRYIVRGLQMVKFLSSSWIRIFQTTRKRTGRSLTICTEATAATVSAGV